jgi:hypothetical protein
MHPLMFFSTNNFFNAETGTYQGSDDEAKVALRKINEAQIKAGFLHRDIWSLMEPTKEARILKKARLMQKHKAELLIKAEEEAKDLIKAEMIKAKAEAKAHADALLLAAALLQEAEAQQAELKKAELKAELEAEVIKAEAELKKAELAAELTREFPPQPRPLPTILDLTLGPLVILVSIFMLFWPMISRRLCGSLKYEGASGLTPVFPELTVETPGSPPGFSKLTVEPP